MSLSREEIESWAYQPVEVRFVRDESYDTYRGYILTVDKDGHYWMHTQYRCIVYRHIKPNEIISIKPSSKVDWLLDKATNGILENLVNGEKLLPRPRPKFYVTRPIGTYLILED